MVSCCILCKDEGYELAKCLKNNQVVDLFGGENVLVVDSSEGEMLEIERMICRDFGVRLVEKKIGDKGIKGIGDLRNYGGLVSGESVGGESVSGESVNGGEWVLYIDVDELFSLNGLRRLREIIRNDLGKYVAYRFPRINLPWYEGWPDYQTRLVNIRKCMWIGDVHESVGIIKNVDGIVIKDKGGGFGILREYPIIHIDRCQKKLERNVKWSAMGKKNVLLCSLFKDSEWHMDRFLSCIKNIKREGLDMEICFIEGNSEDKTWEKLKGWCNKCGMKYILEKMDINDSSGLGGRFDRLAILRNMLIKTGLKGKYDYVLMIDSDVIFEGDLLVRLIESIEKTGSDVMGCMIMIENFRTFGNNYFYDTLAFAGSGGDKFVHYFPYVSEETDKVIKKGCFGVKSVGTCYLVRGEVYNIGDMGVFSVVKCYKEVEKGKKIVMYKGERKSEQIMWCTSVRDAGYKVMVDSSVKVLHVNLEKYGRKWH